MRIAFVGKGGSGKSTMTALFSQYIKTFLNNVVVVDADINVHIPELLGFSKNDFEHRYISSPENSVFIKETLRKNNKRITALNQFFKSTPPTQDSHFLYLNNLADPIWDRLSLRKNDVSLMTVGTYQSKDVGASCYHNNLAILEILMNHLIDKDGVFIVDMVAGIDSFAGTLHSQFDFMFIIVEPTKKSLEVYEQFRELGETAGISDSIFVIGNKIRSEDDRGFLKGHIEPKRIIGYLFDSEYLRAQDREGEPYIFDNLENENKQVFDNMKNLISISTIDPQKRVERLFKLHKKYVAQAFVKDRFGDLTSQIDYTFDIRTLYAE